MMDFNPSKMETLYKLLIPFFKGMKWLPVEGNFNKFKEINYTAIFIKPTILLSTLSKIRIISKLDIKILKNVKTTSGLPEFNQILKLSIKFDLKNDLNFK